MKKLHSDIFPFLKEVSKNNNKFWFEQNKHRYVDIQKTLKELSLSLAQKVSSFDESIDKENIKSQTKVFRIYKDARFSKGGAPYKTNFGLHVVSRGSQQVHLPGYYLHIEPGASFVAGGIWSPEPKVLNSIRDYLLDNYKEMEKITKNPGFKKTFGGLSESSMLKNGPRGYDLKHPSVDFLKYKSFVVSAKITDKEIFSGEIEYAVINIWKKVYPLNSFLIKALKPKEK